MPMYEYVCAECGLAFEQLVRSMAGKEKIECPSCGSKKVERQLSVFAARDGGSASGPACGMSPGSACPHCPSTGGGAGCPL